MAPGARWAHAPTTQSWSAIAPMFTMAPLLHDSTRSHSGQRQHHSPGTDIRRGADIGSRMHQRRQAVARRGQFFQPGGAQRVGAKGRIRPAEFPRKVYIVRTRAEDIRSRASVVQERHTPENAHSPRCFGRRAAVATRAEDDQVFHPQPPIPPPHRAAGGIHILVYDRISYHIYTKKNRPLLQNLSQPPPGKLRRGSRRSAAAELRLPVHCTLVGRRKMLRRGQNPRNSYTYTTLRGTEGKNLAARQGFFWQKLFEKCAFLL